MILNAHCKIQKITHSLATEAGQELGRVDTPQFSAFYFFEFFQPFALVGEKVVGSYSGTFETAIMQPFRCVSIIYC